MRHADSALLWYIHVATAQLKMLRPFQVNVGHFLSLQQDVSPASKVGELCSAIEGVSGESIENQVLLTAAGKQMDPAQLIGAYSVGTENRPIFLFFRSYLGSPDPPHLPSQLPQRGDLQHQLELLKLRPTPSLFQRQVGLAKRLCEHSQAVGRVCGVLSEQYTLQCSGWQTVLNNCYSITRTFKKHQQLFTKAVEGFRIAKPEYLQLLQDFPERVKLLKKLPVPSSLQSSSVSSSLYDWISTHDERNSLLDLSSECKRSLARVEGDHLDTAIHSFQQVIDESEVVCSHDDRFQQKSTEFQSMVGKATELMETASALNQNIQSTSERALRSGDAGTVADLVLSHHKTLQLMLDYCSQMESIGHDLEVAKMALTKHIHRKLQQVIQLQKKVANSNSQLVLLHEHIKLARKRFEILEQVCSTPRVLVNVLSEVERRRTFNSTLEKKAKEMRTCLQQARNEEKRLRKFFLSNYAQHFVSSLFPELQDRLADITVQLPKSLSTSSVALEGDYENLRQLLPQEMRPPLETSSIDLLVSPFISTSSNMTTDQTAAGKTGLSDNIVKINVMTTGEGGGREMVESSVQTGSSLSQSDEIEKAEELLKQLEMTKEELAMKLARSDREREQQKQSFEQQLSVLRDTAAMDENIHLNQCVSRLERKEKELSMLVEQTANEKEGLVQHLSQLESSCRDLSSKLDHCLTEKVSVQVEFAALKDQLATQAKEYFDEKEHLHQQIKQLEMTSGAEKSSLQVELSTLKDQLATQAKEYFDEKEHLHQQIKQLEMTSGALLAGQKQSSSEKTQLEQSLQRLTSANSQLRIERDNLVQELSLSRKNLEREQTAWQEERTKLTAELAMLTAELADYQSTKETLLQQAITEDEMVSVTTSLQQKDETLKSCVAELEQSQIKLTKTEKDLQESQFEREQLQKKSKELNNECKELKQKCVFLEEEQKRQAMRHQRALSTITTLQAKLEQAEKRMNEKEKKVLTAEMKLKALEVKLRESESGGSENIKTNIALRKKVEELKQASDEKLAKLLVAESGAKEAEKKLFEMKDQLQAKETVLLEIDSAAKETKNKLEQQLKKREEDMETLREDKDRYHKQAMESERELRELHREVGQGSIPAPFPGPVTPLKQPEKAATPMSPVGGGISLPRRAAMASLQIGDVALFMSDLYNNYLALTLDGRLYYLNHASVPGLNDLGVKVPQLNLKRKILVGKITERLLVEVKKEGNRLKIPVGTRLYKVEADRVTF